MADMERFLSPPDKQRMVSSFLEVAVGQTSETALQFLQEKLFYAWRRHLGIQTTTIVKRCQEATSWKLEEAIQLFYVGSEGGVATSSSDSPSAEKIDPLADQNSSGLRKDFGNDIAARNDGDEVRPPLPVIREALYDNALPYGASRMGYPSHGPSSMVAFRNFEEEMKHPVVWESEQGGVSKADPQYNLAALYRPPFALMHHGPFEKAKLAAAAEDKWLLVNLQSTKEFSSHMLNRDTWANEAVAQTIKTNFIFWQVYDDTSEGTKVCTYYKVDSVPVILVIDPVTGQKMRSWSGMIHPDSLLEALLQFMDSSPKNHNVSLSHKRPRDSYQTPAQQFQNVLASVETNEEDEEVQQALAASLESMKQPDEFAPKAENAVTTDNEGETCSTNKPIYPLLPDEPKGNRNLICRVGFRLPDGHRVQRNFLHNDPIQLLWSFCHSQLGEARTRPFCLTQAIPGASKFLDYDSKLSIGDSGLADSMISVTWE